MKYRKKPVIIDAEPYRKGLEDGILVIVENMQGEELSNNAIFRNDEKMTAFERLKNFSCRYEKEMIIKEVKPFIDTLEGKHYINETDMIITGVKGERYPCKKDIFDMTYEIVK